MISFSPNCTCVTGKVTGTGFPKEEQSVTIKCQSIIDNIPDDFAGIFA